MELPATFRPRIGDFPLFDAIDRIVLLERRKRTGEATQKDRDELQSLLNDADYSNVNLILFGIEQKVVGEPTELPYFTAHDIKSLSYLINQMQSDMEAETEAIYTAVEKVATQIILTRVKPGDVDCPIDWATAYLLTYHLMAEAYWDSNA